MSAVETFMETSRAPRTQKGREYHYEHPTQFLRRWCDPSKPGKRKTTYPDDYLCGACAFLFQLYGIAGWLNLRRGISP